MASDSDGMRKMIFAYDARSNEARGSICPGLLEVADYLLAADMPGKLMVNRRLV